MNNQACTMSCSKAVTKFGADKLDDTVLCVLDDCVRHEGDSCPYQGTENRLDMVNDPPHYKQGTVECIDALESAVTGLSATEACLTWNVIRYMWRWKHKNGLEDLNKVRWYLTRLIGKVEAQNNVT